MIYLKLSSALYRYYKYLFSKKQTNITKENKNRKQETIDYIYFFNITQAKV